MCSSDIFLAIIAILFPPIAVWIKCGICSADSIINIALCMLGYFPGLLHAWYIIAKYPDEFSGYEAIPSRRDEEGGTTVTYYYVHHGQPGSGGPGGDGTGNRGGQPAAPEPLPSQAAHTIPPSGPPPAAIQQTGAVLGDDGGQGASDGGVPPTYAEAVKGDHKVQR